MIYLNNAATGYPKPQSVIDAVLENINYIPFHCARAGLETQVEDILWLCRKNIAALFKVTNPHDIIFTSGATESLNLAIHGLDLKGKHVITTNSEHNSVIRPLKTLEREGTISLSFAPCDGNGIVDIEALEKLINFNTALIAVNHCSNVTGNVNDITALSSICKNKNIVFLVDASQSAGIIPIDLQKHTADLLAFTGHKSLYGIPGIGGLYIRDGLDLYPLKVGGTGTKSELLFQPENRPIYYEAGTLNIPGIVSLNAGVTFILETSLDVIFNKGYEMMKSLLEKCRKIREIIFYGDYNASSRCPIMSFNIKGIPPEDVGYILESSFKVVVRTGLHCAPLIHKALGSYPQGSVRVSLSYFTKEEEIDSFANSLEQIANMV